MPLIALGYNHLHSGLRIAGCTTTSSFSDFNCLMADWQGGVKVPYDSPLLSPTSRLRSMNHPSASRIYIKLGPRNR